MHAELNFGQLRAWPLPIAHPLRQAEVADTASGRYLHLLHASEALLQFVGTIALLDAAAEGDALKQFRDRPLHASTGVWRACLDALISKRTAPTVPALLQLRVKKARWRKAQAAIGVLVTARNAQAHPIRVPSEEEARERTPALAQALKETLTHFDFLQMVRLLRIRGEDPVTGEVRVAPFVGPDALSSPQTLRWPGAPARDKLVVVDLASGRYVVLDPLYRWHDRKLEAYLRTERGQAQWYAVDAPDRAPTVAPVDNPGWLIERLTQPRSVQRGTLEGARAAFDTSATVPSISTLPLTSSLPPAALLPSSAPPMGRPEASGEWGWSSVPPAPQVAVTPPPPVPVEPPRKRRSGLAVVVLLAIAAAGFAVAAWQTGPKSKRQVGSTGRDPGALIPAIDSPKAVFRALAEAYAAGDPVAYHRHYLLSLECFFDARNFPTSRRLNVTHDAITNRPERYKQLKIRVHAQRGDSVLIEERFSLPKRWQTSAPPSSRWYKLVKRGGYWRIAAEGGAMDADGSPSKCIHILREEFDLPPVPPR